MAVSVVTSGGERIVYGGPIQEKWIFQGLRGNTSYHVKVLDSSTQTTFTLTVSKREYASLKEGQIIGVNFIQGGLGIPYRWRFGRKV